MRYSGHLRQGADPSAAGGFTLVELLVALFITAVMFAIGYGELAQALRSHREIDEQSARLIAIQQAVRTIDQDFELLQPRPVRNLLGDGYLPALTASPTGGNDTLLVSSSSTGPNTPLTPLVTFTRGSWTNPIGLQRSELQRVSYALQGDRLVRQYSPVLDATLQDATITRTLLDHVKSVSLRFMDAGHNWQTQWPAPQPIAATPATQPILPRTRPIAVEVTIELDDWGVIVRHIEVAG
jgi:general secretion pathway protein J